MTDWKPRYIVRKTDGIDGPPIPDDEPVLVVRAQDELSLSVMDFYMARYNKISRNEADDAVLKDLLRHRTALIEWQAANPDKIKRADR